MYRHVSIRITMHMILDAKLDYQLVVGNMNVTSFPTNKHIVCICVLMVLVLLLLFVAMTIANFCIDLNLNLNLMFMNSDDSF